MKTWFYMLSFQTKCELWFQQTRDAHQTAIEEWGLDPANPGAAWQNYYGKRSYEVLSIWTEEYAGQMDRLKRVIGTQATAPHGSERMLNAPMWQENDPDNYVPPHTVADALSGTTYFGSSAVSNPSYRGPTGR